MSIQSSQDLFSQDVEMITPDNELRSGIRSSEIESTMSYSELSSIERNSTQIGTAPIQTENRQTDLFDLPKHVIYGTNVNIGTVMEKFKNFILEFKINVIEDNFISSMEFKPDEPFYLQKMQDMFNVNQTGLDVNCHHLKIYSNELYHNLISFPREVIPAIDTVGKAIFENKIGSIMKFETRPFNCGDVRNLRNLSEQHLDEIVTITGLVFRTSDIIPEPIEVAFSCRSCLSTIRVPCENQNVNHPETCHNCHANFTMDVKHNWGTSIDKQLIKLQESPDEMPVGQTPQTISLYSYQNLVDLVKPGDRVIVTGIYRSATQRENPRMRNIKSVLNTYVDVLHYKKTTSGLNNPEIVELKPDRINEIQDFSKKPDIYERLSAAIAPSIYGNEDIKKGILLQLIGGRNEGRGRGDIHILLCGDPGTSKSQLLQYANNISPRSQYTSGKGASGAGLTAYITRDSDTKLPVLQAGSLVLADNGLCCIDEFDKMTDSTRSALHEVMEQQTFSVAKAGVICKLNARTSILSASNPVGSKWDMKKTIVENIKLPPTLLSRFDLIFLMLNPQDREYHTRLARHLIGFYMQKPDSDNGLEGGSNDGLLEFDFLKDYITYARTIEPVMSAEAKKYLVDEYVCMRKRQGSSKGQVTAYPRQLDSLRRMSQALARVRLSDSVEIQDCKEARRLQLEALKQAAVDPVTGLIDVSILTTGVSGGETARKRREEIGGLIMKILEERARGTYSYQKLLNDLRESNERMVSRDLFEDALNLLRMDNKIQWTNKLIRIL